jgi:hypothetical protein
VLLVAGVRAGVLAALAAGGVGHRVAVLALAAALGCEGETVLASVMPELLTGQIYADPNGDGPGLTPREVAPE